MQVYFQMPTIIVYSAVDPGHFKVRECDVTRLSRRARVERVDGVQLMHRHQVQAVLVDLMLRL
jgi:hypothetical protein